MKWDEQGCEKCRAAWESGQADRQLTFIGEFIDKHSRLYRCEKCHDIWEELERFAHVISKKEIKKQYPWLKIKKILAS